MINQNVGYCECGRRKSRHLNECNRCAVARLEKIEAENRAIVATGKCPTCGSGLRRNNAMAGWWQCEQYGAERFRKDSSKPSCSFQCFTE